MTLKECHERDKDDLSDAENGKVYAPQHVLDTSRVRTLFQAKNSRTFQGLSRTLTRNFKDFF